MNREPEERPVPPLFASAVYVLIGFALGGLFL